MHLCRTLFLIFILAVPCFAQVSAIAQPGLRMPGSSTAHPGLLRPSSDLSQSDAHRSEAYPNMSRAWYLEVRTQVTEPARVGCRQCSRPVVRRNTDLCTRCAYQWRVSGARGWDFPAGH